jgi:hypothetical protein
MHDSKEYSTSKFDLPIERAHLVPEGQVYFATLLALWSSKMMQFFYPCEEKIIIG